MHCGRDAGFLGRHRVQRTQLIGQASENRAPLRRGWRFNRGRLILWLKIAGLGLNRFVLECAQETIGRKIRERIFRGLFLITTDGRSRAVRDSPLTSFEDCSARTMASFARGATVKSESNTTGKSGFRGNPNRSHQIVKPFPIEAARQSSSGGVVQAGVPWLS